MNIISVATWNKRFETIGLFLDNFSDSFYNKYHFILNMTTEDFSKFPQEVYLKYKDKIEFNLTQINYGSTNKLLPLIKYKNDPIMIIDDDSYYDEEQLNDMWNRYNPNCINGTGGYIVNGKQPVMVHYRVSKDVMHQNKNPIKKFSLLNNVYEEPRLDIMFCGCWCEILPPDILKIEDVDISKEWSDFKQADDEWIFKRSLELGVNKYLIKQDKFTIRKSITLRNSVSSFNTSYYDKLKKIWSIIYKYCDKLPNEEIFTIQSCKYTRPSSNSFKKKNKGLSKYDYYVDWCNTFGFENIWGKYIKSETSVLANYIN